MFWFHIEKISKNSCKIWHQNSLNRNRSFEKALQNEIKCSLKSHFVHSLNQNLPSLPQFFITNTRSIPLSSSMSIYAILCSPESSKWTFKYCHLKFKFPSLSLSHAIHPETFTRRSKTLQSSPILSIRSTEMLHLQWDSSPKDDKRFNLLLAMSEAKMSNNLLWTLLVRDGTELLDMQISTEVCGTNGKGNCSGCWSLLGALRDWQKRVGLSRGLNASSKFCDE